MANALVAIGISSIIAQILVLRELVAAFNGNELTYGISLMVWLLSGSFGSYLAGRSAGKLKDQLKFLMLTELSISLIIPAELLFARLSRLLLGIPIGSIPDLNSIFLISLLTIAPLSFLFAFLFTIGSKAVNDPGIMYTIESLGSVIGGAAFTFLLIYFLGPFQIAGMTGLILSFAALYIYKHHVRRNTSAKIPVLILFSFILAVNLVLIHPIGQRMDRYSSKLQWKGLKLIRSVDSIYGRIAVIEDKGTLSYFENGNLMFSTATVAENEEMVHLSFIEANDPDNVLLIGGGLGGVNEEILKHRPRIFDYVEFDPKLAELAGSSIRPLISDGRLFIRNSEQEYDLIIVNVGDPASAALNRFYTYEFLTSCRKRLTHRGVLMLKLSASEAFMRRELKELNASVNKTLNAVFPQVIVIPGNYNYYYATGAKGVLINDASQIINRWKGMKVPAKYFNELSIPHIVQPFRIKYMEDAVRFDKTTELNTDLHPISYLYSLLIWLSYFPGILSLQLQKLIAVKLTTLAFFLFAASLLFKLISVRSSRAKLVILPIIIGMTGFCAMTLQLLTIYSFQALYGNIYAMIAILMAVFMGGLALGSYLTNVRYPNMRIGHVILSLLISIICFMIYLILAPRMPYQSSEIIIPLFSFVFASLVGGIFPAAVRVYRPKSMENKAGVLYGSDLFGGSIAALLASIWFLPVFGIIGTCFVACLLNLSSLILAFHSS